jgi:predicted N-acetyltransferase YhbS
MSAAAAATHPDVVTAPFGPGDQQGFVPILDAAFGPGRHAKTSERVRENGALFAQELSRAAFVDGRLVGGCQIWRIRIGDRSALFLGPLAVHPEAQRNGLGAKLVLDCVAACRAASESVMLLVGAPSFFAPLGFERVPPNALAMPGPVDPNRLLWQALQEGALQDLRGPVSGFRDANPA